MIRKRLFRLFFVLSVCLAVAVGVTTVAGCKKEIYKVTFVSNGGSEVESQSVKDGSFAIEPDDPVKDGYVFDGWHRSIQLNEKYDFNTPVSSSITLYAAWKIAPPQDEYTVTFIDDGSAIDTVKVISGNKVNKPDDPEKIGFIFEGWLTEDNDLYDFNTAVTDNLTLTAKWADAEYTVTFENNGGTTVIEKAIVAYGEPVARPDDPVKNGFRLENWYADEALETEYDFTKPVTKDITLYAKWAPKANLEVTFESNGGSAVSSQQVPNGQKAVLPKAPEKSGSTFGGWYTDSECTKAYDFDTPVTLDITLYAKWSNNSGTTTPPPADDDKLTALSINFNDIALTDTIEKSDGTTYQGKNLEANSVLDDKGIITLKGGQWEVDANKGNITDASGSEVAVANRLKSKGVRTMEINLSEYTGQVKLQFFVRTASKNDLTRGVSLSDAAGTELGKITLTEDKVTPFEVTVDCGATYTLTVITNGVNFYGINIIPVE